jgi:hypothetical protein
MAAARPIAQRKPLRGAPTNLTLGGRTVVTEKEFGDEAIFCARRLLALTAYRPA